MLLRILILLCVLVVCRGSSQSQSGLSKTDSLKTALENAKSDTSRIKILHSLGALYQRSKPDSALYFLNKSLSLSFPNSPKWRFKKANIVYDKGISFYYGSQFDSSIYTAYKAREVYASVDSIEREAMALNLAGVILKNKGELDSALVIFKKIADMKDALQGKRVYGASLNNIGLILYGQAKYLDAIDFYTRSVEQKEIMGDSDGVASTSSNIGLVYNSIGDYEKAEMYYRKALRVNLLIGDERSAGISYNNLGTNFQETEQWDSAYYYLMKGLEVREKINDEYGLGSSYNNLGAHFLYRAEALKVVDVDSARKLALMSREYAQRAFDIRERIGDANGVCSALNNLGSVERNFFSPAKAVTYCKQSFEIASEKGFPQREYAACECLQDAYSQLGDYTNAYKYLKRFNALKDTLNNDDEARQAARELVKFEYEQKKMIDSLEQVRIEEQEALVKRAGELERKREKDRNRAIRIGVAFLALVLLVIVFILLRGNRIKKKANQELEKQNRLIVHQKQEVEAQKNQIEVQKLQLEDANRDITDSIRYAKRLQEAILPDYEEVKDNFSDVFILYKPKDIIAGDFYWLDVNEQYVSFAVADCTGHGVPGAMVSMVCSEALDKAIALVEPFQTNLILDKAREFVVETLASKVQTTTENMKDGMDISLITHDKKSGEVYYSGANNPIWIIRKGSKDVEELKADRQPVGAFEEEQPFSLQKIKVEKGDRMIMFTDGYVDQFGGEKGKKLKVLNFKELIINSSVHPVKRQGQQIEGTFQSWKSDYEQLDDVCVAVIEF